MKKLFLNLLSTLFLGIGLLYCGKAKAQHADSLLFEQSYSAVPNRVSINNIFIIGNQKTKKNIILRELNFTAGITYNWEELISILAADQKKLYNLQLFNTVELTPLITGEEQIEILITVDERRYFIPSVIFELADRNFSEWWTNQNRSFRRVNYGARFYHYNVGGRNEKLRLSTQFGFTQAFDLRYSFPYIDKNQKHGLTTQISYRTNKTIAVRSSENKQVFFTNENEDILRRFFSLFAKYSYRGSFYNFHYATIGYNNIHIHEDVLKQNKNYFLHGDNKLSYFVMRYEFTHDQRNYNSYPTHGTLLDLGLAKYGLFGSKNFKDWEFTGTANKYFIINNKFHAASSVYVNAFFGKRQPFTSVRGIGYNPNFIRGYELNVIEGQQSIVNKNSLRYNLLDLEYDISRISPISGFTNFPIKLYISANFDHGYVNDKNKIFENQRLTNQHLLGFGPGLDLVIFYDLVFRFEYSRNNQNEGNFFINIKAPF